MTYFYTLIIILIPLSGLVLSNIALDRGLLPFPLARKIGHILGGIPYLISPWLFDSSWPVVLVSAGFTVLLTIAHLERKELFRGVGGVSRPGSIAEVTYPLAGTISLLVGWTWLGNPWLGVVPILYMSWGDGIAGIIRYVLYAKEPMPIGKPKRWEGSIVFITVCALVALLFQPYWVAFAGLIMATIAESLCSQDGVIKVDDNLPIALSALATIVVFCR